MTDSRKKSFDYFIEQIASREEKINVAILHGSFGAGKSEFLEALIPEIQKQEIADACCSFDYHFDKEFLVDYLTAFEMVLPEAEMTDITYNFDETTYNKKHLHELLKIIRENDEELFDTIIEQLTPVYYKDEEYTTLDKQSIEERLSKFIDKKGDLRFITHHNRVIAESFLVDLMSLFYPLNESFPQFASYLKNLDNPIRIVIVQDNIDVATYTVAKWLNDELLPLFLNGKFFDFISYDIDEELKDIPVSKFFDFVFIISSRINLKKINSLNFFADNGNNNIIDVELSTLNLKDTEEYLTERNIDVSKTELIYTYSFGIPFLIDLLCDYEVDEINEVVRDLIYDTFTEKLLDGRDVVVQEGIKMSAFIESFDQDFLRCNRKIGDNYNKVFSYMKFTNDLFEQDNGKISLREPFKKIVAMSLERNHKSEIIEYRNIASVYNNTKQRYSKLNSEELNVLRSFAYFNCFDMGMAIEMAFDDKSAFAKDFVSKHSEFFNDNIHTKSLKTEHKGPLDRYNKIIDREKYELKKQLIANIWKEREEKLKNELNELEDVHRELNKESEKYGDDPAKVRQEYDSLQKVYIEKENDFIKLREKLERFSYNKYIFSFIVNLTAAVMSFIIGYLFPDLFATPKNHSSIIIIQYILYFISLVFFIIGGNFIYKTVHAALNKKGLDKLNNEIKLLEDERTEIQTKMKELKSIFVDWQKNVNKLNEQMKENQENIRKIKEILTEKYIY